MNRHRADIEFILAEVERFARLPREEYGELTFYDALSHLPHPSGSGMLICGYAANSRLNKLAEYAISKSRYVRRVAVQSVAKELQRLISKRFIGYRDALTDQAADRVVAAAIKHAARQCTDMTHIIPCHICHDQSPALFQIGPVTFMPMEKWLTINSDAIQKYPNHEISPDNEGKSKTPTKIQLMLAEDTLSYYKSFSWVAQIHVKDCEPSVGRQLAMSMVRNAIDVLHLLVGAPYSKHFCIEGAAFRADRRGEIALDSAGDLCLRASIKWRRGHFGETWWQAINRGSGNFLIEILGVAIKEGNDIRRPAPLAGRFLDALTWYGEAVRDEFTASRIVKYITAMERVLIIGSEAMIADIISSRGAALMYNFEVACGRSCDSNALRKRFRRVYDFRSRLVHGSNSPMDDGLGEIAREAEELCRAVLRCIAIYYGQEGFLRRDLGNRELKEAYAALSSPN
ncbi:HEPN domain-containing protein [Geminicoccaceae bacterium 1502E]|nr:HEPN domain-containing protein [Geminicoccaceae bacterium 1502E]